MKKFLLIPLVVILISGLIFGGCAKPIQFRLTIGGSAGGTVTVSPNGPWYNPSVPGSQALYAPGTIVNLTATPLSGWAFLSWTGDVETVANVNSASTTVTMNGNYTVTANFVTAAPAPTLDFRTATKIVAANNASATFKTGADYVCDGTADDVEIQAALNALPTGRVILSEGTFNTTANLTVPANATLEGQGNATIISASGAAITNAIVIGGDNAIVRNLKVVLAAGAGAPRTRPNCIYATKRTNLLLEALWLVGDLTVEYGPDVTSCGICFVNTTNSKIVSCRSEGNRYFGIYLYSSDYNAITSNSCQSGSSGIRLYDSSYNAIIGNTCCNNGYNGIDLEFKSCKNTVTGNQCDGNSLNGIEVRQSSYNTVTANVCCNQKATGIHIEGDATVNADGNTLSSNVCRGNAWFGIDIVGGANANFNLVMANQLQGNTTGSLIDQGRGTIKQTAAGDPYNVV